MLVLSSEQVNSDELVHVDLQRQGNEQLRPAQHSEPPLSLCSFEVFVEVSLFLFPLILNCRIIALVFVLSESSPP